MSGEMENSMKRFGEAFMRNRPLAQALPASRSFRAR
jgi:hypothetical protein